jgi:hypothetical protein
MPTQALLRHGCDNESPTHIHVVILRQTGAPASGLCLPGWEAEGSAVFSSSVDEGAPSFAFSAKGGRIKSDTPHFQPKNKYCHPERSGLAEIAQSKDLQFLSSSVDERGRVAHISKSSHKIGYPTARPDRSRRIPVVWTRVSFPRNICESREFPDPGKTPHHPILMPPSPITVNTDIRFVSDKTR